MTGYKKVFIDTAPFIYFIEKDENNPEYFEKVKNFLNFCYQNKISLITSTITQEEYFVFPYKTGNLAFIDAFNQLIAALNIKIISIDEEIADCAAKIRADFSSFKAMDAIQLATAKITECDAFLTNDKQLKQFDALNCITVSDL